MPPLDSDRPWAAGGLVSALLPMLEGAGGGLWFGWSGDEGDPEAPPKLHSARGVDYATIDLSKQQLVRYYGGYCNRLLWPLLHGMPDRAAFEAAAPFFEEYRAVNRRFADALLPLLREGDLVWVHDYHLLSLGEELRRAGWSGPIGYFNHTPIPLAEHWAAIPDADALARDLGAYDLIGVQTQRDARRLRAILGPRAAERVEAYPIAIHAERFRACVEESPAEPRIEDDGRLLFFGVDRLDYTKAIPQRLEAFGRALDRDESLRTRARFVQWAAPSRTHVPEYRDEREALLAAAEAVRERHPGSLHLDLESRPPPVVAAALKRADVCVVSSYADGMNLVAKEYAALHSAEEPGVLILSDACGAAEELTDALIYPSGDVDALADAMVRAANMSEEERRARAQGMRDAVDGHTALDWLTEYIGDLEPEPAAVPSLRVSVVSRTVNEVLRERVEQRLSDFERDGTIERLWARDHLLWKPQPREITDRLGWLDVDRVMAERVGELRAFADEVGRAGYTRAVLLGMGGSSLSPRVFASAFGRPDHQGLDLIVLDSTVPDSVRSVEECVEPGKTLFIVSSKSGTTLETRALLDYFWERYPGGQHYIAITDPGSPLAVLAEERRFRRTFLNPPDIGGRYSALSYSGLVPAALLAVDLQRLLQSAAEMREACSASVEARANPGARLGAMLAEAALMGRDCLMLQVGPELGSFGAWLEQLIAESTGKDGVGILPVFGAEFASAHATPDSRFFMAIGDAMGADELKALALGGSPVAGYRCSDPYQLGAEYFRWEFGVAVAGSILGINPFDQPDVEATKRETARLLERGVPRADAPPPEEVFESLGPEQYLALHAYLPRTRETDARLEAARERLSQRFHVPTTVEYGPALLHSTGQYHKGGPGRGTFIQVVDPRDGALEIPGRDYGFDELKDAQASGDLLALTERERLVARICSADLESL